MPNTLLVIDHTTTQQSLAKAINHPQTTYTLFITTNKTKLHQLQLVKKLRESTPIPPENHLTINIKSIIQKTWRIINHYLPHETVPPKHTPDRKAVVKKLSQLNHQRLANIQQAITHMVIQDQATKLSATPTILCHIP